MIPFSAEGGHCTGSCGSSYSKMVWKRDKKEGGKKEAMRRQPHIIHLESRWRWRNFLRKLLFNCSGFMLGSETATSTRYWRWHSSILGKRIQKKQLQHCEFVRKGHQRVSDCFTYEPRLFLPPCSVLAKICLIPYFIWDAFIQESCEII